MTSADSRFTFRFGGFELDVAAYELRRDGHPVRIERQPMDLLILLVEHRGDLVSRSAIIDRLWGRDVFVDVETGVHTAIRKIRQALRDSPDAPAFVETVPGKGYRFIARVEVASAPDRANAQSTVSRPAGGSPTDAPDPTDGNRAPTASGAVARVQPAASVRSHDRWSVAGMFGMIALVGISFWWWMPRTPSFVTLAVLPFTNLSGDPDREYLAEGLAEDMATSLGQIDPDQLALVARTSTIRYKGTTKSVSEIGRELGADYLVESSIRAEAGRLRVTSRLVRVRDQLQVWSQAYDREPTSMLGVQRELSAAIAEQIRLRLSADRLETLARRQTGSPEAYDLFLRGRNFENQRTPATSRRAIEYYTRATALDPDYALAWSAIAMTLASSPLNGDASPADVMPRILAAAAQAVRAGPDSIEVQHTVAYVKWCCEWDWPGAEAALQELSTRDPHSATAHLRLGHALSQLGRHSEALSSTRRARELDPLNALVPALSSQVAFQARDYRAALDHAQQAIVLDPEFWIGHMMRGQALEQLGEYDAALEALTVAARFSGQNSKSVSLRAYILTKIGQAEQARAILRTLETTAETKYVPPYAMALIYAGLGQHEAVYAWLERAYDAKDVHLIYLTVDPKWDSYSADARFEALVRRCGFRRDGDVNGL